MADYSGEWQGPGNDIYSFLRRLRDSFKLSGSPGVGGAASWQPAQSQSPIAPAQGQESNSLDAWGNKWNSQIRSGQGAFGGGAPMADRGPASGYGNPSIPGLGGLRDAPPSFRMDQEAQKGFDTKLDRGTLSFAWNGDQLRPYDPNAGLGQTPDQGSQLEASRKRGLMGHGGVVNLPNPMNGGQPGPGYTPSQTDWSKVANPMAFEAYRQQPEIADQQRYLNDPLWHEKGVSDIEQNRQIAVARAQSQAQADAVAKAAEAQRNAIQQNAAKMIDDENKRRASEGKPPLTMQEQQVYKQYAAQDYTGKYGMI